MTDPASPPLSCAPTCLAESPAQAHWFRTEIHTHDAQLKSYLRGSFPSVRDVDDVVQESYLRVWRRHAARPIASAKAFLFRVARNVALDVLRRRQTCPVDAVGDLSMVDVVDERPNAAELLTTDERVALLISALDSLPPRCRTIVVRCKLHGHSHRDVAQELGISEKTVAEHVYRGTQRIGLLLQKRNITSFTP